MDRPPHRERPPRATVSGAWPTRACSRPRFRPERPSPGCSAPKEAAPRKISGTAASRTAFYRRTVMSGHRLPGRRVAQIPQRSSGPPRPVRTSARDAGSPSCATPRELPARADVAHHRPCMKFSRPRLSSGNSHFFAPRPRPDARPAHPGAGHAGKSLL